MDLFKTWEEVTEQKFSQSALSKEQITDAIRQNSKSVIAELQKRLKYKLFWIVGGAIITSLWMLFNLQQTELLFILGAFQLQGLIFLIPIGSYYYKMTKSIPISSDTLRYMKTNARLISKALQVEMLVGLTTVPWSVVGGILLYNYYAGNTISAVLHNPVYIITVIISLFIAIPFMFIASTKANTYAYGKYIRQLNQNIQHLENT